MRNGNGCLLFIGLMVMGLFAAACLTLSLSVKQVAPQGMAMVATSQAEPPTVGERAESIRAQTRLDNGGQGIPAILWVSGIGAILFAAASKFEKLMVAATGLQKAWQRGKKKVPALRIERPPQYPQLPQAPSRPQLPTGGEEW